MRDRGTPRPPGCCNDEAQGEAKVVYVHYVVRCDLVVDNDRLERDGSPAVANPPDSTYTHPVKGLYRREAIPRSADDIVVQREDGNERTATHLSDRYVSDVPLGAAHVRGVPSTQVQDSQPRVREFPRRCRCPADFEGHVRNAGALACVAA
jgi:hypothetical protein